MKNVVQVLIFTVLVVACGSAKDELKSFTGISLPASSSEQHPQDIPKCTTAAYVQINPGYFKDDPGMMFIGTSVDNGGVCNPWTMLAQGKYSLTVSIDHSAYNGAFWGVGILAAYPEDLNQDLREHGMSLDDLAKYSIRQPANHVIVAEPQAISQNQSIDLVVRDLGVASGSAGSMFNMPLVPGGVASMGIMLNIDHKKPRVAQKGIMSATITLERQID